MPTPEEQALLKKMRAEISAKDKRKAMMNELAEKEAQLRAKWREADALKLQRLKLQREEIKLEEKTLWEYLEAEEAAVATETRRENGSMTRKMSPRTLTSIT